MKMKILDLRNAKAAKLAEARSVVEAAATRDMSPEESQKFEALMAEVASLDQRIGQLEALAAAGAADPQTNSASTSTDVRAALPVASTSTASERAEFRSYLRGETRATVDTTSAGMMIPTFVADQVMQEVADLTFMRSLATVKTIPGNTKVPVINGVANFAAVPEGADYPELEASINGPTLAPHKIGGIVPLSYEIVNLAGYDVEAEIASAIAEGLSECEEELFVAGTGSNGTPTGVATAATARVNAAKGAITAQNVIDLYYKLPQKYRARGTWLMHPETAAVLRGLTDSSGALIWQPGLTGNNETLLGRPVYTSEFMPKIGTSTKSVVFGDFSKYVIGDRKEQWILPLRELYAGKGKVALQITAFLDANIAVDKAFGAIKHAAS